MGQTAKVATVGAASDAFTPLMQPSRYKALYGGRASGKSQWCAEALVANAATTKGLRAVCVREIQKSLAQSAKLLLEDKIKSMGYSDRFEVLNDRIKTPGDGIISFLGMQDHTSESIKSLENFNIAWCEEAQTMTARSLEMLRPTIRAAGSELWFSWNPRHQSDSVDQFFRGLNPPADAIIVNVNYDANDFLPAEMEAERLHDYTNNPQRYDHVWRGGYEPQAIGAIFSRQNIHDNRVAEAPELGRIVIAVDPAVSSELGSNEHGIVAVGRGDGTNDAYVLGDYTCGGGPLKWAERAVAAYDELDADAVVIEVNQGGDMCKQTLQTVRPGIPVVEVRATRGKHVRAEPIAAIYSLGRVHHAGSYPELESQLCLLTNRGYEGEGSPDRADALVWGLTELFPQIIRRAKKPVGRRAARGWMG